MRLTRVYFDTDLRSSFQGLRKVLRKDGIEPAVLGKGSLILFMNRKATAFKCLAGNDYLAYFNYGKKFPLEAIQYLPTYFNGEQFEFTKAIEKSIKEKLRIN